MTFRLMVLDDEPWQLSWIKDMVTACGGEFITTATFGEAKAAFDARSPEIVVVDIRIGEVDEPVVGATLNAADPSWIGLRLLKYIRVEKTNAKTKLFVYTGLDREELRKFVEDAYQSAYYTKFEPSELEARLWYECKKLK